MMKRINVWIAMAALAMSIGCGSNDPVAEATITSDAQMETVLAEARSLSEEALRLAAVGEPLSEPMKNDLIRAGRKFDALLEYAPDVMSFYLGKAKIDQALGDREGALKTLISGSKAVPDVVKNEADRATAAEVLGMAADLQIDAGEYESAMTNLKNARRLMPENVDYMATEVRILIQMKQYPAAKAVAAEGLRRVPTHKLLLQLKKLLEVGTKT